MNPEAKNIDIADVVTKAMEKNKDAEKFSQAQKDKIIEVVKRITVNGETMKEAFEIPDDFVNIMYAIAFVSFNGGKYQDAIEAFEFLYRIDPFVGKYPFGIAAAYHKQKEYDRAVSYYLMYTVLEPNTPIPWIHLSDCYENLHQYNSAFKCLKHAVELSETDPIYEPVLERAKLLIKRLKKQYEQHKKETTENSTDSLASASPSSKQEINEEEK